MRYRIPQWPENSNLTHKSSSWMLAKDENMTEIEDSVSESTEHINDWVIDKLIPTGQIWYIKVKRHLYDSDDNELVSDNWIGPKPIINEESNVNEHLAPKFYVDDVYLKDYDYTVLDGLMLNVKLPDSNVSYLTTNLVLKDDNNNVVFNKDYDLKTSDVIIIEPSEVKFFKSDFFKLFLTHTASRSTVSKVYEEIIFIRKALYKIEGKTELLNPMSGHTLNVVKKSDDGLKVVSAILVSTKDDVTRTCGINNDVIINIPEGLQYNSNFHLELTIEAVVDGVVETIYDIIPITTLQREEAFTFNRDVEYKNRILQVATVPESSSYRNYNLNHSFLVEESFVNTCFIPNNDNVMSDFIFEPSYSLLSKLQDSNITLDEDYSFKLIFKDIGVLQTVDADGKLNLKIIGFNGYTLSYNVLNDIVTNIVTSRPDDFNLYRINDNNVILIGMKDERTITINKIDLYNGVITNLLEYSLSNVWSDLHLGVINDDKIIIVPKSSDDFNTLVYDYSRNEITSGPTLHSNLRDKELFTVTLNNGNVLCLKKNDGQNSLEFNLFSLDGSKLKGNFYEDDSEYYLTSLITLKNGNVIFIDKHADDNSYKILKFL